MSRLGANRFEFLPSKDQHGLHVLYLHPASVFGGAAKSLIEVFKQLRCFGFVGTVLAPRGPVCAGLSKAGFRVYPVHGLSQFDNTRFGHYRRLRWVILLRELWFLPFSIQALWCLRGKDFDIIHVNEITLFPLGIFAKFLMHLPLVVHVRSLQCSPKSNWRTRILGILLRKYADAVVAIDQTVAETLEEDLPLCVVHNGVRLSNGVQEKNEKSADAPVRIGFLGALLTLKGVFELVAAMRILKERGVRVECIIAGENIRELAGLKACVLRIFGFARDVRLELERYISRHALHDRVKLIGFVDDIQAFYSNIDVLCFPSHLDAVGRPVFEAALCGIPSIAAVHSPKHDAIIDGVTGIVIDRPDPVLISNAIQLLVEDPDCRKKLGGQAKVWAEKNFDIVCSSFSIYEIYQKLIEGH